MADANARIDAPEGVLSFGPPMFAAGDVDGDGVGDLLTSASNHDVAAYYGEDHGQLWLVPGGSFESVATVDSIAVGSIVGARSGDSVGYQAVSLGDWNDDGFDDFAMGGVGEHETDGRVAVVYGPFDGDTRLDATDALLSAPPHSLIYSIAAGADLTVDGRDDLVVASSGTYLDLRSDVWLITDPVVGFSALADVAAAHFTSDAHFVYDVFMAGDLDGDGSPGIALRTSDPMELLFIEGPLQGELGAESVASVLSFDPDLSSILSFSAPGDSDGDGRSELPIGMQNAYDGAGVVFLLGEPSGPVGDVAAEARATLTLEGGASVGTSVAFVGDLDADGFDDLAVGAQADDIAAHISGDALDLVVLLYGPVVGHRDLADADAKFLGEQPLDQTHQVGHVGDLDGDLHPDLALGGSSANLRDGASGSVYLFLGAGL